LALDLTLAELSARVEARYEATMALGAE